MRSLTSLPPPSFSSCFFSLFFHRYAREFPHVPIGYSGHETGVATTVGAVALGACVVERHFTLDRTMKGGDHRASLEPADFARLVAGCRAVRRALGDGVKRVEGPEKPVFAKLAKSLVSARALPRGTVLARADLTWKSPGTGIAVSRLEEVLGKRVARDIEEDVVINEEDVEGLGGGGGGSGGGGGGEA